MRKIIGIIGFFLLVSGLSAQTSEEDFLAFIKEGANYAPIFRTHMDFEVFTPGGETTTASFTLYENNGKSIAMFLSPARDKGKVLLQIESKYWIYFPKTKRASVLSPMASLVGNASNGDVLRPPPVLLYNISMAQDVEPKWDHVVEFTAQDRKAPYGRIISHYQGEKLMESELYSRSGILMKKVYYEDHIKNQGGPGYLGRYARIVDGGNEEKYTIMKFSQIEMLDTINENWFNPNNLGRVR